MDIQIEINRLFLCPFEESDAVAANYNSRQLSMANLQWRRSAGSLRKIYAHSDEVIITGGVNVNGCGRGI